MAINYITKKEDYLILQKECKIIFKTEKEFPENLFQSNYIYKLFFENSVEDTQEFYNLLIKFIKEIGDKRVVFFTITPDSESYFYHHFKKYSTALFSVEENYDSFITFLQNDPGDSPADALAFNAEVATMFSESNSWGLITSKKSEMGVIGFNNFETYKLFNYYFANSGLCYELSEYIDYWKTLLRNIGFPSIWTEFEKNYRESKQ